MNTFIRKTVLEIKLERKSRIRKRSEEKGKFLQEKTKGCPAFENM